ncbi:MAG: GNAT family N-acetyltransferase [Vicinamibacterales bacterium]
MTHEPAIIPIIVPGPVRPVAHEPGSCPVVRAATDDDAPAIHRLITENLQSGHLLPRSLADVTARASRFSVAVSGEGAVLACGELAPLGASVAEVRSLVVRENVRGQRLGQVVVDELRRRARAGRYRTLCAFTHDPRFFVRFGFSIVPHTWLPEKVAADCWSCAQFRTCRQYAVIDTRLGWPISPPTLREGLS